MWQEIRTVTLKMETAVQTPSNQDRKPLMNKESPNKRIGEHPNWGVMNHHDGELETFPTREPRRQTCAALERRRNEERRTA